MKLAWGRKVACPSCSMRLYDMIKSPVECPYCGHQFEDTIDARLRKKTVMTIEETIKSHIDFEFSEEGLGVDDADSVVLDDDSVETDIDVMKIKELSE